MSIQVKRRREAASFLSTFTGAQAELIVDTTNNRVQVHDGSTAGGWPAAKLAEVVTNTRTAVADTAYTALASDRCIAYTAITAARIVTLPAASTYPTGTRLVVFDESGNCSATLTITLAAAGSDTIDAATSAVISSAYGYLALQSNGSGKWTIVDQATSNLGPVGIGTAADPNNPLSVYGPSALFNGTNFNVTVNKAASGDTASFIFEDGFSGRAQIGLCGDDNFHFKVSANGSTWYDALDITDSSGLVTANFGLTVTGKTLTAASTTSAAGLNIAPGTAPTSPNNGDFWTATGGMFGQINGGTRGLVSVIGQSHIPFVMVSSGTMGNNGALSGIMAVATAYPSAYVYLPAGAISTGSAAGWYYAVFSSTTAATVYNNVYTSGTPQIPASPTAFATTGPGAYTQTTGTYIPAYTLTIAGNTIGPNGAVRISKSVSLNNTSGAKAFRDYLASTELSSVSLNTSTNGGLITGFANRGVTNVQSILLAGNGEGAGTTSGPFFGAVDTTSNQNLTVQMDLVTATDTMTLESVVVELIPGVP
ncbi:MAG: hypothetical protein ACLQIQ_08540 [Beijerinckiaceae bacterium]